MTETDNAISKHWIYLFAMWIIATFSTVGSLFFSEIMKFPPCVLCWYQRIAMYPLVLIFLAALFKFDRNILRYTLPLSLIGWVIAVYHNLLSLKIIPESASPCVQGVPCSTVYVKYFGFLTIPVMSFIAFSLILLLSIIFYRNLNRE